MKRILALLLALSLLCMPALADETDSMLAKSDAYLSAGDFDSAAICLDIAQKLSPNDPTVLRAFARLHFAEGDTARALEAIETALALAPADGTLYLEKARLLYATGNLSDAEQALRYAEICSAEPDDELLSEAAQAYIRAGQYETAIELCESQASDALRLLAAQAYERAGLYERAVAIFETLPEAVWQEASAAYAHALMRSENLERARALGLTTLSKRDEALAAAIRDGRSFRLIPADETLPDSLMNLPVFCSTAYADEFREKAEEEGFTLTPSSDGLRVRVADTLSAMDFSSSDIRLLSVSPSGRALLIGLHGFAAVVRDQEITLLTVNRNRGAQNEYSDITYQRIENRSFFPTEPDAFCWSPDERYITMTFLRITLIQTKFMDLLLADTRAGDIFLAESTPKRMVFDGVLTATTACFDPTGAYVYYLAYGDVAEDTRSGLKRYCLETGEAELLCTVSETFFYYPQLSVDWNGDVRAITDTIQQDHFLGVITFTNVGGKWESEMRRFPNPMATQAPQRYYRSENSGYELFLSMGLAQNAEIAALEERYYLTLSNDVLGTGSDANALRLPVDGSGSAEAVEISEFLSAIAQHTIEQPFIQQVTLSPDGYSALILAVYKSTPFCFILDLDTLACRPVEFPEDAQPDILSVVQSYTTLSWLEDGRVLIPTSGTGRLFTLTID